MERIRRALDRARYVPRAIRLVLPATGSWTPVWAGVLLAQGLLPALTVYLTKILVDAVASVVGAGLGWESAGVVLAPAAAMGGVLVLAQVLSSVAGWIRIAQTELVQDHVKELIHTKAAQVDLEFYDSPEYFDHMARANSEADTRSLSILQNLGRVVQNTVTLIAISGLLLQYAFWVPLVLLVGTLPALWVAIRHNRRHHAWWRSTTEQRRWIEYYDRVLTLPSTAPEVRLFGLARHFQDAYARLRRSLREARLRLVRRQTLASIGAAVLALAAAGGVLVYMVGRALRGAATLGDLALFYQAFNQGQGLMRTLSSDVGQLYADTLFLEHLFEFLGLEPRVHETAVGKPLPMPLERGIDIRNVSFRYPGTERLALRDFDLSIGAGSLCAIVGANGAGKSTLIKLLCRFYDPQQGSVQLDGVDVRDLDLAELRSGITALFQLPVAYAGTVAESIAVGDLGLPPDQARIEEAARYATADEVVDRLPRGYATILGRQFRGGVQLSAGEFQRIALARALYRRSAVLVLDEPTSHMDSWTETRWLDTLREAVAGRTTLLITHRFTTAMRADAIHVMDRGRIVESGTHTQLLGQGGLYAVSWKSQMQERSGQ